MLKPAPKITLINNLEKHLPNKLSYLYHNTVSTLKKLGYKIEKITFPKRLRENLPITYLILCSSELVSHLNSLQGITYGVKEMNVASPPQQEGKYKNISITHKRSKCL